MMRENYDLRQDDARHLRHEERRAEPLGEPILQRQRGSIWVAAAGPEQTAQPTEHRFFFAVVVRFEHDGVSDDFLMDDVVEATFEAEFFFADTDFGEQRDGERDVL